MTRYSRFLCTALSAAAVLALTVAGAAARNLSISNQNVRAVWSNLRISNDFNETTIACQITLEGSFHSRTFVKRVGSLIGYVTRGSLGPCTGGPATINRESLPWHLTYEGFTGTLPNIATVRILLINARVEINIAGLVCRMITETRENASAIATPDGTGRVTGLQADETRRIVLRDPFPGFCTFLRAYLVGTARFTLLNSTAAITIRLI